MIQEWLADTRWNSSRLVVATRDAVAAGAEAPEDLAAAAVWGLLRSAQTEHPDRFGLLDLGSNRVSSSLISTALTTDEPQLAVSRGALLVPRMVRLSAPASGKKDLHRSSPQAWQSGTVLITGGGTLGAALARHLVRTHQVRDIVWASRRGIEAAGVRELCLELSELEASVDVVACDVADRDALAEVLAAIPENRPLRAVVHTAGATDDGIIESLTPRQLGAVWRGKVDGLLNLHELTRDQDLDAFVVFSAAAGLLGNAAQANYAAANAFVDALVQHRRRQGLPGMSLAWGLWDLPTGMTSHLTDVDRQRLARSGIRPLSTEDGLALLDAALLTDRDVLIPMHLDLTALRTDAQAREVSPVLQNLLPAKSVTDAETADAPVANLRQRLEMFTPPEQERMLLDVVRETASTVLGHGASDDLSSTRSFKELGFDSLSAMEFRNRIATATGLRLPATMVFDHPTPAALAQFLLSALVDGEAEKHEQVFAELDRLQSALADMSAMEDRVNRQIETRLTTLLRNVRDRRAASEVDVDGQDLDSATADEIIEMLDAEFDLP